MKTFQVTVTADCPAPRSREYRIEASGFSPAIGRAIKNYRKDLGRKKITTMRTSAILLNNFSI